MSKLFGINFGDFTPSRSIGLFLILLLAVVTYFISTGWLRVNNNGITVGSPQDQLSNITFVDAKITNGWTPHHGAGVYSVFQYAKTKENVVILRGLMDGCPKNGDVIFQLPVNFAPEKRLVTSAVSNAINKGWVRIDITENGAVHVVDYDCTNKGAFLSLSGISFAAN